MRVHILAALILLMLVDHANAQLYPSQQQLMIENNRQRDELLRQQEEHEQLLQQNKEQQEELYRQNQEQQREIERLKEKQEKEELGNDALRGFKQLNDEYREKERQEEAEELQQYEDSQRTHEAAMQSKLLLDRKYFANLVDTLLKKEFPPKTIKKIINDYQQYLFRLDHDSELGDPEAQYRMGVKYLRGEGGVKQNMEKGADLLKKSAAQGNKDAQAKLEILPRGLLQ